MSCARSISARNCCSRRSSSAWKLGALDRVAKRARQIFAVGLALDQVVLRPVVHGGNGHLGFSRRRQHDDRRCPVPRRACGRWSRGRHCRAGSGRGEPRRSGTPEAARSHRQAFGGARPSPSASISPAPREGCGHTGRRLRPSRTLMDSAGIRSRTIYCPASSGGSMQKRSSEAVASGAAAISEDRPGGGGRRTGSADDRTADAGTRISKDVAGVRRERSSASTSPTRTSSRRSAASTTTWPTSSGCAIPTFRSIPSRPSRSGPICPARSRSLARRPTAR